MTHTLVNWDLFTSVLEKIIVENVQRSSRLFSLKAPN